MSGHSPFLPPHYPLETTKEFSFSMELPVLDISQK